MATLYDLGQKIVRIREAVNEMNVKGSENASLVVYATKMCNEVIQMINDTAQEEGAKHEPDSDTAE